MKWRRGAKEAPKPLTQKGTLHRRKRSDGRAQKASESRRRREDHSSEIEDREGHSFEIEDHKGHSLEIADRERYTFEIGDLEGHTARRRAEAGGSEEIDESFNVYPPAPSLQT